MGTFCTQKRSNVFTLLLATITASGCVQSAETYYKLTASPPAGQSAPSLPKLSTQSETISLEASDRIARFRRLANAMGTTPPQVDELYAPPGTVPGVNAPVPVVRLVFDEKVFFDFDQAAPRPEAMTVIEAVASSMKRDVPDAAVTILGHTDAVGSEAYNLALSQRRASRVFSELIERGVNANQLSTVAIGKAQPIATNATDEGRARNRRVEFLISGSERANLSVLQDRSVNSSYLTLAPGETSVGPRTVNVLKPARPPTSSSDEDILGPAGMLTLRTPEPVPISVAPAAPSSLPAKTTSDTVFRRPTAAAPAIVPREPDAVVPAPLRDRSPPNF